MFDLPLRPLKDLLFTPLCPHIPPSLKPHHITLLAFLSGLLSTLLIFLSHTNTRLALLFWALNRALDCLDGTLARHRGTASDLGGFLDLWCDFIVYSILPIAVAAGAADSQADAGRWVAVAVLEASFHVNNFVLFYVAALVEKARAKGERGSGSDSRRRREELTSVSMRPALVEGLESALLFTAMLGYPSAIEGLSWTMAALVVVGIGQRTVWVFKALW
ncbi:MAG: hypothetical protein LQ339_006420 [Xanthoria mediterranea]|nr:MAG: hypothetical protein LQ339_006420 [Xanthoria mediterranea]